MNKRHLAFALLFLCALCSVLVAQATRVELFGIVRDPSDLPVSGATVQIRNVDTSLSAETTSESSGLYRFVALLPGNYQITVRKEGFSVLKRSGLTLRVGEQVPVDLSLMIGNLSQSVEVSEAAPLLQDVRGTVSFTASKEQVATLPLDGRNFIPLIALSPGVMLPPASTLPRCRSGTACRSRGTPRRRAAADSP